MGLIDNVRRIVNMLLPAKAKEEWDIKSVIPKESEDVLKDCAKIYEGNPPWENDNVKTIKFAKTICEELAGLTMLGTSIKINGSKRADYLQKKINDIYYDIPDWVEYALGYGNVVLKPNEKGIDVVLPDKFIITGQNGKDITGIVFISDPEKEGNKYYTRLEYHRFENDIYIITNIVFCGDTEKNMQNKVNIKNSPFRNLEEECYIKDLKKPLFTVLSCIGGNSKNANSAVHYPIYEKAMKELSDLDIAYSRYAEEIEDSERIVLIDSDKLIPGTGAINNVNAQKSTRKRMELPRYVRNVTGNGSSDFYQEINPSLNTSTRIEGINFLLSLIGYKCGFSNGYFTFNQHTGMVTATQVESDDRRTIQTVKRVRDKLEKSMNDIIYALDQFAYLYNLAPAGDYEVKFDFGDITYNHEEDKAVWWNYVMNGKISFWRYLVKFEGMTEEEAKTVEGEAKMEMKEGFRYEDE